MSLALLFPGQGAQEVGMGIALAERFSVARDVFSQADCVLPFSLTEVMFRGPVEKLRQTEFAQPAILAMGIAFYRVLTEELGVDLQPNFLAGHSLGEYTAHVVAGTISFEDALPLVNLRGRLMQNAVPLGVGGMAAIIGMGPEEVVSICNEVACGEVCEAVNFNAPAQTVISGHLKALDRAMKLALQRGARRAMPLNVSAPFHSSMMCNVALELKEAFETVSWQDPAIPVVTNVNAFAVTSADEARETLYLQANHPVRWSESVTFMRQKGVSVFLELGPGNVLAGLAKRILDKNVRILNVKSVEECLEFPSLFGEV